ncbi:hypothetical protein BS47DRAFT_1367318 [Hydnum rufescens UP504]|uniref:Uncharacterized protein n=1 Tax=Hydnum rufescens UP504 TaxID=1448309 RepID=A0A9P6AIV0_9AGAM|nr:hypothetical protein BS47DRAFT_1367318 [Hydnum rufescens UP504]
MKIISTWLDWLLYDLDVDSTDFLNWVVHDFRMGSTCYKLDPVLAHAIWQCRVILGETVQEIPLFYKATTSNNYGPRPRDLEKSNLKLAVIQAKHCLWDTSNVLASYLKEPDLARRNHAAIERICSPWGNSYNTDLGLAQLVTKEAQTLHCCGANLLKAIPGPDRIDQGTTSGLEITWTPEIVIRHELSPGVGGINPHHIEFISPPNYLLKQIQYHGFPSFKTVAYSLLLHIVYETIICPPPGLQQTT